jgi:hypothetical protein
MRVSLGVHVVQTVHHLVEVCSGHFLRELACFGNEIEELSSADVLQHDGETTVDRFILLLIGGVLTDADQFDQVFVVELLHDVELVLEGVQRRSFLLVLLDGHQVSVFVLPQLHSKWSNGYCA